MTNEKRQKPVKREPVASFKKLPPGMHGPGLLDPPACPLAWASGRAGMDYVFRNHAPRGYLGRLCRIIQRPKRDITSWRIGNETIRVEFDDGEQLACVRSAVVPVDSRIGRQALRVGRLSGGQPIARRDVRRLRRASAAPRP